MSFQTGAYGMWVGYPHGVVVVVWTLFHRNSSWLRYPSGYSYTVGPGVGSRPIFVAYYFCIWLYLANPGNLWPTYDLLYFELCPTLAFWIMCSNWCPGLLCSCVFIDWCGPWLCRRQVQSYDHNNGVSTKLVVVITLPHCL